MFTKKAEAVINAEEHENLIKNYDSYKSCMKQLTQILKEINDKDDLRVEIESVETLHGRVIERLVKEKEGLFKNIRTKICREHVRKKYSSKSQKASLINKKF
ncbi:hypothetical protein ACMC5U_05210 [Deferribacteres bacterium DY0609]|nr:hypothetical protein [Denitrovibrio acetiphilus]